VIVVLAGTAAALTIPHRTGTPTGVAPGPIAAPGDPTPATRPPLPTPNAEQTLSWHGVEVRVPATWKPNAIRCATPVQDTVIFEDGAVDNCLLLRPRAGLNVVRLGTTAESVKPEARDHQPRRTVEKSGAFVGVEAPDVATINRILATVHVVAADGNACPSRVATLAPPVTRGPAQSHLVDTGAVQGSICRYSNQWLARSVPLGVTAASRLASQLRELPAGAGRPGGRFSEAASACAEDRRRGFLVRLWYDGADRYSTDVWVHITGCDGLTAAVDGLTSKVTEALITTLVDAAGFDGGFPGSVH
ncbi:MAG: hypothetical protein ACR2JQ_09450, partial [Mycobacteriales bacterium]